MPCPSDDELASVAGGALAPERAAAIHRHADGCAECRRLIAALAIQADPPTEPAEPDPEAPVATPAPAAGAAFGRYHLLYRLGEGGMGVVYAAYDPQLDRRVALKLLRERRESSNRRGELQARLQREAQALAKLAHPNVVSVHDVGTHGGRVFMAMEFVEGTTLRHWAAKASRTWQESRDAYVQAGRGLAAAHRVGLVHRDFKPDNALAGADGRVRVADFGLARAGEPGPAPPSSCGTSAERTRPSTARWRSPARGWGRTTCGWRRRWTGRRPSSRRSAGGRRRWPRTGNRWRSSGARWTRATRSCRTRRMASGSACWSWGERARPPRRWRRHCRSAGRHRWTRQTLASGWRARCGESSMDRRRARALAAQARADYERAARPDRVKAVDAWLAVR